VFGLEAPLGEIMLTGWRRSQARRTSRSKDTRSVRPEDPAGQIGGCLLACVIVLVTRGNRDRARTAGC
jgi:hypothetical protein